MVDGDKEEKPRSRWLKDTNDESDHENDEGHGRHEEKPRSRWLKDTNDESDHENDGRGGQRETKKRKSENVCDGERCSKIEATASLHDNVLEKKTIHKDESAGDGEGRKGYIRPGMSMAERAAAELEEFRQRQRQLVDEEGDKIEGRDVYAMKSSPDVSSPEEDMHIRREGSSFHGEVESEWNTSNRKLSEYSKPESISIDAQNGDIIGPMPPPMNAEEGGESIGYPEVLPESPIHHDEENMTGRILISGNQSPVAEEGNIIKESNVLSDDHRPPKEKMPSKVDDESSIEKKTYKQSMLNECRSVDEHYEKLNRISEGTYGVVYRARQIETGRVCALKRVKLDKERDGFPLTSIREINILLSLAHPSIVNVSEVVVGSSLDQVFMVMEYAEHDLRGVMEHRMNQPFTTAEAKCLMLQLLSGVAYLHDNWVIHRDLKTSNILYTNRGELKLCDFGLARQYADPLRPYTHMVVTLWYRAPELLLGAKEYSTAVDMWSCGCIMAEILQKKPIFTGQTEIAQLDKIFKVLGVPDEESWPGLSSLKHWKDFRFKGSSLSSLRQIFPPPGPVFDGRTTLNDAGFDLLSGLLTLCPVSFCCLFSSILLESKNK